MDCCREPDLIPYKKLFPVIVNGILKYDLVDHTCCKNCKQLRRV